MLSKKLKLISFELCPYVQRSVITLLEKGVDFDLAYIDLSNKPAWFLKLSPFGKVPILQVNDIVVFESAVINEYLDEVNPPALHPADPLKKALNRSWIEFGSGLLVSAFQWAMAADKAGYEKAEKTLRDQFRKLEDQFGEGPYFNGDSFSLVDAAYAPFFMRHQFVDKLLDQDILLDFPQLKRWSGVLLNRESVQKSVIPDIEEKYIAYIRNKPTYMGKQFLATL